MYLHPPDISQSTSTPKREADLWEAQAILPCSIRNSTYNLKSTHLPSSSAFNPQESLPIAPATHDMGGV